MNRSDGPVSGRGSIHTDPSLPDDTWTVGQAAHYLNSNRSRVYWLFCHGHLSGYQLRERAWVRIYPDSVRRFREWEEAKARYRQRWKERHGRD